MSLEQAVLANTAAIEKLTALLAGGAKIPAPVDAERPVTLHGDKPSGKKVSGKATGAVVPATAETVGKNKLTYAEVRGPFLDLVQSSEEGKNAALALLAKYEAKNLQAVPEEHWPAVLEAVKEARG